MFFKKKYWTDYNTVEFLSWSAKAIIIIPGLIFKSKCESVKYYIEILNTKRAYAEFRRVREITINRDPIALAKTLDNFSTNKEYEKHVIEVIRNLRNVK